VSNGFDSGDVTGYEGFQAENRKLDRIHFLKTVQKFDIRSGGFPT